MEKGKEIQVAANQPPSVMIAAAVNSGADLDKLEKVLEIQMKWEANEAKKAYHVAMSAFKKNPPEINKDKKVAYKEVKYSHASLANVVAKITKALSKHGLSATWNTKQNGAITVSCKITHVLGHSEETTLTAPADTTGSKNPIQAMGSTISYLERYTLLAATGLATSDQDDDGQGTIEKPITDKQVGQIRDMLICLGMENDESSFLEYLEVSKLEEMPASKYQKAMAVLKAKEGAKK